jgi:carbohydrate-selective porin OprB
VGVASSAIARGARWAVLAAAIAVSAPVAASAQPYDVPPTWGGDFWSRPRLTGDWFGFRDEIGKRGVVVDVDFLQILQGTATGERDTGVSYGGTADYTLNVDTSKLGLWPGGFFKVYAMSGFGDSENANAGVISAVNMAALLPEPTTSTALMGLTYMQFFATWIGALANFVPFLRDALSLGLDHEDAVELYYTVAATKWLGLTVDLQIVNPGLKKTLTSSGELKDVGGLRAFARF